MNKKYALFPFNIVGPNTKIAIYGAGEIFTNFKQQIEALNYCEVGWVIDKKFDSILRTDNSDTDHISYVSPSAMEWHLPDYIVIASIAFANEIENEIIKLKGNLDQVVKILSRNVIYTSPKSKEYWNQRYITGLNSGPGSYSHLAEFKAKIINDFISKQSIRSVIEFGSGDGNQLGLSNYEKYLGFDVSAAAVAICKEKFKLDNGKCFKLVSEYNDECAELALSLDVIFHLVEYEVYEDYMNRLFSSSSKYIIIYSSNSDLNNGEISVPTFHVKHRKFSRYVEKNFPNWDLEEKVDNKYVYNGDYESTSFSDFYIYIKNR